MKYKIVSFRYYNATSCGYMIKYGYFYPWKKLKFADKVRTFDKEEEAKALLNRIIKQCYENEISDQRYVKAKKEADKEAKEYNKKSEVLTSDALIAKIALTEE